MRTRGAAKFGTSEGWKYLRMVRSHSDPAKLKENVIPSTETTGAQESLQSRFPATSEGLRKPALHCRNVLGQERKDISNLGNQIRESKFHRGTCARHIIACLYILSSTYHEAHFDVIDPKIVLTSLHAPWRTAKNKSPAQVMLVRSSFCSGGLCDAGGKENFFSANPGKLADDFFKVDFCDHGQHLYVKNFQLNAFGFEWESAIVKTDEIRYCWSEEELSYLQTPRDLLDDLERELRYTLEGWGVVDCNADGFFVHTSGQSLGQPIENFHDFFILMHPFSPC